MTKRRRWLLLSVAFLAMVGVVGYLALWLSSPRPRINGESIKLIKVGMTQEEVEAILGVPPGNYSSGPICFFPPGGLTPRTELWIGEESAVHVSFDASRKVVSKGPATFDGFSMDALFRVAVHFLKNGAG
jgi:hypothetical protein